MYLRSEWIPRIEDAFDERSIAWLNGVRRVGKTVLCRSLPDVECFDYELPRTRRMLEDPEGFLNEVRGKRIFLGEIHRLMNPSEILKIAADHHPDVQILATGSSTLGASLKFRDTLTGRKRTVWLTPMTRADLRAFQQDNLTHRLQCGGLPPFFLAESPLESDYQEWLDSYWAKDIQELFRLEQRTSFQRLVERMAPQSGGSLRRRALLVPARSAVRRSPMTLQCSKRPWSPTSCGRSARVVRPSLSLPRKSMPLTRASSATHAGGTTYDRMILACCGSPLCSMRSKRPCRHSRFAIGGTRTRTRSISSSGREAVLPMRSNANGLQASSIRRTSSHSAASPR